MLKRLIAVLALVATPGLGAELGDDGLHKADWMRDTFKDLSEDFEEAQAEGKRLAIIFEQRGCIYCTKMHKEVFSRDEIADYIRDNYFVVQMNLHGDIDVTDLDGDTRSEKAMARKWGVLFTPSIFFIDDAIEEGMTAPQAAVAVMPGAFGPGTTIDMFTWVAEKRYEIEDETGEDFQRYHARRIQERNNGSFD